MRAISKRTFLIGAAALMVSRPKFDWPDDDADLGRFIIVKAAPEQRHHTVSLRDVLKEGNWTEPGVYSIGLPPGFTPDNDYEVVLTSRA